MATYPPPLIKLAPDVYVNPSEVTSIQFEEVHQYSSPSISDSSTEVAFSGSIVTLKNGRKLYIRNRKPDELYKLIKDAL